MDNQNIMFSIIVPVYNVEDYIEECIRSVLYQDYNNYELILIDDGSTDNSYKICKKYSSMYDQIKTYHKNNRGLIHTRRYGLERAAGEYILHLDSDDLLEQNALYILESLLSKHQYDCVFFNRKQLVNGELIEPSYHIVEEALSDKRLICKKALIDMPYNGLVLKCAKRSIYRGYDYSKYYHISSGEDLLQSIEILDNCNSALFVDNTLYIYRKRKGSIVNTTLGKEYKIDFTVRKYVLRFLTRKRIFNRNDMDKYRDKCINILINQIIEIGLTNLSFKEKEVLFNNIRNDSYYIKFLSRGLRIKTTLWYKVIIFNLFKQKKDIALIGVLKMRSLLYRFSFK